MPRSDLTPAEQDHVRALLRVLHVRYGNWHSVERALPLSHSSLWSAVSGRAEVTATIAFRVARVFDASCKHCWRASNFGNLNRPAAPMPGGVTNHRAWHIACQQSCRADPDTSAGT